MAKNASYWAVFDENTGAMSSVHTALWAARGAAMERNAAVNAAASVDEWYAVYERAPEHDRRFARGDDFAGDAWRRLCDGQLRWVVVGRAGAGMAADCGGRSRAGSMRLSARTKLVAEVDGT
jgi:hypothetical protein